MKATKKRLRQSHFLFFLCEKGKEAARCSACTVIMKEETIIEGERLLSNSFFQFLVENVQLFPVISDYLSYFHFNIDDCFLPY